MSDEDDGGRRRRHRGRRGGDDDEEEGRSRRRSRGRGTPDEEEEEDTRSSRRHRRDRASDEAEDHGSGDERTGRRRRRHHRSTHDDEAAPGEQEEDGSRAAGRSRSRRRREGSDEEAGESRRRGRRRRHAEGREGGSDSEPEAADQRRGHRRRDGRRHTEALEARQAGESAQRRRRMSTLDEPSELHIDDVDLDTTDIPRGKVLGYLSTMQVPREVEVAQRRVIAEDDVEANQPGQGGGAVLASGTAVYVESLTTGLFRKVPGASVDVAPSERASRGSKGEKAKRARRDVPVQALSVPVEQAVAAVILCCQGILAGLTVLTVLTMTSSSTTPELDFLFKFSHAVGEVRRATHILATVATAGAIERLVRERENAQLWAKKSPAEVIRAILVPVLYLVALAVGWSALGSDNRVGEVARAVAQPPLTNIDEVSNSLSAISDLLTEQITSDIAHLGTVYLVRSVLCVFAWFFVCIDYRGDGPRGADAADHQSTLQDLQAAKARVERLAGETLHRMSEPELSSLLAEQRALVEATERAVEIRRSRAKGDALEEGVSVVPEEDDRASVVTHASAQPPIAPPQAEDRRERRHRRERSDRSLE